MYGIVYLIWNMTNGKKYVGQTVKTVEKRFSEHAKTDSAIGNAIRKYGAENFRYGVIKSCETKEEMDKWEIFFIAALRCKYPTGYNLTDGGGSGWGHTPETCAKISAAHKGKKFSPEHCANMSAVRKGKKLAPETCAKIGAAHLGKKRTKETCAKISAALTGKKKSPEHRAKDAEAHKGKPLKDETREKMSISRTGEKNPNYGKPREAETCLKLSAKNRAESLYKNLVAELESRQMTYTALAKLMDLNPSTVSEKMRSRKKFSDSQIAKLVEIFNKPIEYLLKRDE